MRQGRALGIDASTESEGGDTQARPASLRASWTPATNVSPLAAAAASSTLPWASASS
jgi:hypothetical protein